MCCATENIKPPELPGPPESHPHQIRTLFAIILTACSPSSHQIYVHMAEDIFRRLRKENSNVDFTAEIYNEALLVIEDVRVESANKVHNQLEMSPPNQTAPDSPDVNLHREQNHNTVELPSNPQSNIPKLTLEQNGIYNTIMRNVNNALGGVFFLDALEGLAKRS
nr:unnamed protein product [Spirometra erinaceieuropaei]